MGCSNLCSRKTPFSAVSSARARALGKIEKETAAAAAKAAKSKTGTAIIPLRLACILFACVLCYLASAEAESQGFLFTVSAGDMVRSGIGTLVSRTGRSTSPGRAGASSPSVSRYPCNVMPLVQTLSIAGSKTCLSLLRSFGHDAEVHLIRHKLVPHFFGVDDHPVAHLEVLHRGGCSALFVLCFGHGVDGDGLLGFCLHRNGTVRHGSHLSHDVLLFAVGKRSPHSEHNHRNQ